MLSTLRRFMLPCKKTPGGYMIMKDPVTTHYGKVYRKHSGSSGMKITLNWAAKNNLPEGMDMAGILEYTPAYTNKQTYIFLECMSTILRYHQRKRRICCEERKEKNLQSFARCLHADAGHVLSDRYRRRRSGTNGGDSEC